MKNNTKIYWIKDNEDFTKCPLCNSELDSCHIGTYCSNEKCPYFDGCARLTEKQAIKYKDKIIKENIFPKITFSKKRRILNKNSS